MSSGWIFVILAAIMSGSAEAGEPGARAGDFVANFAAAAPRAGEILRPALLDRHVNYDLDPNAERFLVHVPSDYDRTQSYGLLVYMHPGSVLTGFPAGWVPVADERHLLLIGPTQAGNDQDTSRRLGLAVLAAEEMLHRYNIDAKRVYVGGWSGGARIASNLGFYQADVFHGTVQSCGSDFYLPVPKLHGHRNDGAGGSTYGLTDATEDEIAMARQVRFALITGAGDFRHGDILDIYAGFREHGFQAQLFDVPGMGHENADATTLKAALDFIDPSR